MIPPATNDDEVVLILASFIVFGLLAIASRGKRAAPDGRDWLRGLAGMGAGAAKIVVLALPLGRIANLAFGADPVAQSSLSAWAGVSAATLQFYFTISGIADVLGGMRILCKREVPPILATPMRADSFTSGWQQWNLDIQSVVPGGDASLYAAINVLLLSVIAGLAFGFTWAVAAWTAIHWTFVGVERWRGRSLFAPAPLLMRVVLTLFGVVVSMALLRASDLPAALAHWHHLFVSPKPTLYSVLLEARIQTTYFSTILFVGGTLVLLAPGLNWILELRSRVWQWVCILAGVAAIGMTSTALPAQSARSFIGAARHGFQWVLLHGCKEGNASVHVGSDGWLFPQSELDRLTMQRSGGAGLVDQLRDAALRLQSQDVPLLVVLVPSKAALFPEAILPARYAAPAQGIGYHAAFDRLRAAGVEVIDLGGHLWELKPELPLYFKTDSHWTPEAMKEATMTVSKKIRKRWPRLASDETPPIGATILDRVESGDLSHLLDPWGAEKLFPLETTQLVSIRGMESVPDAPVLLLGDESLAVFEDPESSFGNDRGERQHAGFPTHFATLLGRRIEVGATDFDALAAALKRLGAGGSRLPDHTRLVVMVMQANHL